MRLGVTIHRGPSVQRGHSTQRRPKHVPSKRGTAMPMEAWLHGAATTAQVSPVLKNLLDGLASVPPAPVYERLLCLASPPSSTGSRSEVHLIRDLTSPHSTWCAHLLSRLPGCCLLFFAGRH